MWSRVGDPKSSWGHHSSLSGLCFSEKGACLYPRDFACGAHWYSDTHSPWSGWGLWVSLVKLLLWVESLPFMFCLVLVTVLMKGHGNTSRDRCEKALLPGLRAREQLKVFVCFLCFSLDSMGEAELPLYRKGPHSYPGPQADLVVWLSLWFQVSPLAPSTGQILACSSHGCISKDL